MNNDTKHELARTTSKIKNCVIDLADKCNKQNMIIESIENQTEKNRSYLVSNMIKFNRLLESMDKDPKNKIIVALLCLTIILTFYLIY